MKRLITFLLLILYTSPAFPAQGFFTAVNVWNATNTAPNLLNNAAWTVAFMGRRDDMTGAPNNYSMVFAHTTITGPSYSCSQVFMGWATSASQKFAVNVPIDGGASDHAVLLQPSGNIGELKQQHITITHTSGNVWKLYINGTVVNTSSTGFSTDSSCVVTAGGTGVSCGVTTSGIDRYCYVADLAEWSSVLPDRQIWALAHGSRPNLISVKPIVWWPFDDEWTGNIAKGIPLPNSPDLTRGGNNMLRPATVVYNQKYAGQCACIQASGEATH